MAAAPARRSRSAGVNTTQPRLRSFTVVSGAAGTPGRLRDLANNLWWVWHRDSQELFEWMDAARGGNACTTRSLFLDTMDSARLDQLADDPEFKGRLASVLERFDCVHGGTGHGGCPGDHLEQPVAYFSMEFGLHESIPIYSGGLGLLAGDHIKSASDLNLPFIGVLAALQERLLPPADQRQRRPGGGIPPERLRHHAHHPVHQEDDEKILVSVELPGPHGLPPRYGRRTWAGPSSTCWTPT